MENKITQVEGFELIQFYVRYYCRTKKFYSLERDYDEGDIVSELFIIFTKRKLFEKYNPKVTSKKYYMMMAVQRGMIVFLKETQRNWILR